MPILDDRPDRSVILFTVFCRELKQHCPDLNVLLTNLGLSSIREWVSRAGHFFGIELVKESCGLGRYPKRLVIKPIPILYTNCSSISYR